MTIVERRPEAGKTRGVAFPLSWGEPPKDASAAELRAWIAKNIEIGRERRAAGESVPWLAKEVR